jgi:hypothetical protein
MVLKSFSSQAMHFLTNNDAADRMTIAAGGTVTIAGNLNLGGESNAPGALYINDNSTTAYTLGIIGTGARTFEFRGSSSGADYETSFTNPSTGGHNVTINGTLDTGKIRLSDNGNTTIAGLQLGNQGLGISAPSTDQMNFITADTTRLQIQATGEILTAANGIIETASSTGSLTLSGGATNKGGTILLRGGNSDSDIVFKAEASTATPAERMRITSTGSVGIGQVPSTTAAYIVALQVGEQANLYAHVDGTGAGSGTYLSNNITNNAAFKYINADAGSLYAQASGSHKFSSFASGSAGATATEVHQMTINASGDVLPGVTGTQDLGSSSLRWANVYTGDLHLANTKGNDVDGTTGDWTIQEGEENLYIKNNKTGKKYKFALEEIT